MAVALKNISTETVAEALVEIYSKVGIPQDMPANGRHPCFPIYPDVGQYSHKSSGVADPKNKYIAVGLS